MKIKIFFLIFLFNAIFPFSSFAYKQNTKIKCIKEGAFRSGQCIKVDNHLLYAESFGKPTHPSIPTVIFLPGSGYTHQTWNKVAPQVAKFAHVVTYDRSGYGPSQQYTEPKALTAPLVVNNLISLLKKINLPPPYILVGHSHGGLFSQYFALTYPDMVKGIVLVDSSTAEMVLAYHHFHDSQNKSERKYADPHYYELLGTRAVAEAVKSSIDIKGVYPFNGISTTVLTAENHKDLGFTEKMEKDWNIFQAGLVKKSKNSYQIIAYKSGHFIQIEQPSLVIDAIYTMVMEPGK